MNDLEPNRQTKDGIYIKVLTLQQYCCRFGNLI